jgi:hypothetical protein
MSTEKGNTLRCARRVQPPLSISGNSLHCVVKILPKGPANITRFWQQPLIVLSKSCQVPSRRNKTLTDRGQAGTNPKLKGIADR